MNSLNPDNFNIKASVLIIGLNCSKTIAQCLATVQCFAEVVYVDGGSKDNSIGIARNFPNVKIFENPWPGFIAQRNFSIDCATMDWCFMIDADEQLTLDCAQEINRIIGSATDLKNYPHPMYKIVRTEFFEGREVSAGIGQSDYQERLFIRNRVRYTGGNHHEHLIDGVNSNLCREKVGAFPTHLRILHDQTYRLEDMLLKVPRFSLLVGREKFDRGRRVTAFGIVFTFVWTFCRFYIKSLKMKERGVVLSFMKAFNDSLAKLYIYNLDHCRLPEEKNIQVENKYLG